MKYLLKNIPQGSIIGLATPAGIADEAQIKKSIETLENWGFKVKPGKYLSARNGYLAGSDAERAEELHALFADPAVKAIQCVRGGYGAMRLLELLDFDLISENRKPFIGYSDISVLLNVLYTKSGLITFHGQMGVTAENVYNKAQFFETLVQPELVREIRFPSDFPEIIQLIKGEAEGFLMGGNLAVLAGLCGTPFQINFNNAIVFLEEINEAPYRIDRMLEQLILSGSLRGAKALVFGTFANCETDNLQRSFCLLDVLTEKVKKLGIPAVYGFPFGHIAYNCMLPVGARAKLSNKGVLQVFSPFESMV